MGTRVHDTHQTPAQIRHDELIMELEYLYENGAQDLALKNITKHLWMLLRAIQAIEKKIQRL